MEELEVPTEHLHEHIQEKAEESKERWSLYVVLSTAFMAVLAAVSGLLGGHHANEALLEQIKSSNDWSHYQAKSIKSEITANSDKLISTLSTKPVPQEDISKLERYEKEKEVIQQQAEESEKLSEMHLNMHNILARSVTFFQIGIAIAAIAILTKRKQLWMFSILLMVAGIYFLVEAVFF